MQGALNEAVADESTTDVGVAGEDSGKDNVVEDITQVTDDPLDGSHLEQESDTETQNDVTSNIPTKYFGVRELFKEDGLSEQDVIDGVIHVLADEFWQKPEIMEALENLTGKHFARPAISISSSISRIFGITDKRRDSSQMKFKGLIRNWLQKEGVFSDSDSENIASDWQPYGMVGFDKGGVH
jgi:hypothetical protein